MKQAHRLKLWHLAIGLVCVTLSHASASPHSDETAIRALISAENQGAQTRNLDLLESIWAEDGAVRDAHHTPGDLADDQVWQGRDAILLRYETVIFYLTLKDAGPTDLEFEIGGNWAVVTGTTHMGAERSPQGERWAFVKRGSRWSIAEITFNLEQDRLTKEGPVVTER